ncbi:pyridoxal phosphate-dependent aminotransferase [Thiohalophilus sp.]|uniref:pyridoxal phosphate-dependent aminotransferase n=1 Tax=Thiohalophilus sp. TaxID=3028392 RepID=UPI002ACDDA62|nr:pyridoxal phosphate-dependent aminotransferase [Thiohalophilus sp.]MDZ7804637.1 pyridoxal phosphate-dependent aminotransferase [Thiohalophilus sp.]
MSETPSRRIDRIQPFRVMALLAEARELEQQGHDVVHMEIGEPDFPTPAPVIEAATRALADGNVHYTPALGMAPLREAIAGFYQDRYAVSVPAARIMVTPGASGALLLALGVLLEPGQGVMLADPGYPCNRNFAYFLDARVQAVPVNAETGYQLTLDRVQQYWQPHIRVVMLASPANPTGTLVPPDELRAIIAWVEQQGASVIVDEIYHGLVYGAPAPTALELGERVVVINSFSKYFGMTGWRIGWLVAPSDLIPSLDKLAQNLFLSASTPAQHAALAALTPQTLAILEQRREAFWQRRDFLLPALREIGFDIKVEPQGAFYLYADCSRFTDDSFAFAQSLLRETGVAVTPGNDFGDNRPEQHVRFAYTTSLDRLKEGVRRLQKRLVQDD